MQGTKKEKIAIANIKQYGAVSVCYVGGSMFEMDIPQKTDKPIRFNLEALETLVSKGQAAIVNKEKFATIKASILPDGSTKTHNADGSEKSTESQVLEQLTREGFVDVPRNNSNEGMGNVQHRRENRVNTSASPDLQRSFVRGQNENVVPISSTPISGDISSRIQNDYFPPMPMDPNTKKHKAAPNRRVNPARMKGTVGAGLSRLEHEQEKIDAQETFTNIQDENNDINDNFQESVKLEGGQQFSGVGEKIENTNEDPLDRRGRDKRKQKIQGDLNGDGVVDEFDSFVGEEQRKNLLVIFALVVCIILSFFLFFFSHATVAKLLHGESFVLFPENPTQQPQENNTQPQENTEVSSEQMITGNEIVNPKYDPEAAVASYQLADDDILKAVTNYLVNMKKFFIDGPSLKPDGSQYSLRDYVNLDLVAEQLAQAYVDVAMIRGHVPPEVIMELKNEYMINLKTIETDNAAQTDTYGSIFCGRLREVRIDPIDSEKIYIVMQSGSGDLQRICFEASCKMKKDEYGMPQKNENGFIYDIMIQGVKDAKGYMNLVADGQ